MPPRSGTPMAGCNSRAFPDDRGRPDRPPLTPAEVGDMRDCLLGLVPFVPQALQLLPAVGELADFIRGYRGQRGTKGLGQELEIDLVPDLRGAYHAKDPVQLVQPLLVGAVEDAGDRLAVRGA
jgi:hypothetical protein